MQQVSSSDPISSINPCTGRHKLSLNKSRKTS